MVEFRTNRKTGKVHPITPSRGRHYKSLDHWTRPAAQARPKPQPAPPVGHSQGKRTWQWMIGHYGGVYMMIPAENWEEFKADFPKGSFPRRVQLKDVRKDYTVEGEERFHKAFPKSQGMFYDVYFADSTKAEKILTESSGDSRVYPGSTGHPKMWDKWMSPASTVKYPSNDD